MKKCVFIINQDWYFCLHWMQRAKAAQRAGFDVWVAVPHGEMVGLIEAEGFKWIETSLSRNGIFPVKEVAALWKLFLGIRRISPNLIINITVKPNVYGSVVGTILRCPVVNNVTGLGSLFSRPTLKNSILRRGVLSAFCLLGLKDDITFLFENKDDRNLFLQRKIVTRNKTFLMPGSGVDPNLFKYAEEPKDDCIHILFAARLLWDKGIKELVQASEILKNRGLNFKIFVAGIVDCGNSNSVPIEFLEDWEKSGLICWLGQCDDMPKLLASVHIAVLPSSYGEGIPRFLIEAASCGRPIVTTDISGCRDFVIHEKNGLIVPPNDPVLLANSLSILIANASERCRMGNYGRRLVLEGYTEDIVTKSTLKIYKEMSKL